MVTTVGRRRRARVGRLLMAAVLVAALLPLAAGPAGAEGPPPNIPPDSVRIPFSVDVIDHVIPLSGTTTSGEPRASCYTAAFIVIPPGYATPTPSVLYPDRMSFYEEVEIRDHSTGETRREGQYRAGTSSPWLIQYMNAPDGEYDPGGRTVYRIPYAWEEATAGQSTEYPPDPELALCAPSQRAKRIEEFRRRALDTILWTIGPVEPDLVVDVSTPDGNSDVGQDVLVTVTVENTTDSTATGVELVDDAGLEFDPAHLELVSGPDPPLPAEIGPGGSATVGFVVRPLTPGTLPVRATVTGSVDGAASQSTDEASVRVPPDLSVELTTSVTAATKVGDEFDVTATLTNSEGEELTDIRAETLVVDPPEGVSPVSGPTTESGEDPRVAPITLAGGQSTTISWRYRAEGPGAIELTAQVTGREPYTGGLFGVDASTTVAIEAPALEVTDFRMQPGAPVPSDFGNLRGTITNVGTVDVTDVDFELTSNPELVVVERLLRELDPSVSPRIDTLAVGESREFLIPVGMVTEVGGLATYTADLTMTGSAEIGGETSEVSGAARAAGGLDLSGYWFNLLDQVRAQLSGQFFSFFEGVNDWGDSSTLGGVTVGSAEGVLTAFQKMGDGLLTAGELVVTEDGRTQLTKTGRAVLQATLEYAKTTTPKEMVADLASVGVEVGVEGVDQFAEWMFEIDKAAAAGDYREVSALFTEPGTVIATGVGAEVAAGQLFTKFMASAVARKGLSFLKKAPDAPNEAPGATPDYDKVVDGDYADLKDMPTGVPISGQTVARAGLTVDEHGWMIEMAKEHGVAFFVRPRPREAAKWARLGYNAKPMAIKFKSVSDIDAEWLGYPDGQQGVVIMREPTDPFPAMKEAVERGELEWGGAEIDDIIERYNLRKAEWNEFQAKFDELNAANGGEGFDIQRYGKTIRTKLAIDADGTLRMTWNNKPIFSDIDLLQIGRPDGSPIDPDLHRRITEAGGFGIDGQHGDSAMTSDFPNWKVARKVTEPYVQEHTRGGDPLVIVQPDVTTLGYVDNYSYPDDVPGSGYDLYGQVTISYEGAAP